MCARCGTRLMLVVEPTGLRYEESTTGAGDTEEHLLERISGLENRLARMAEKLEKALELLLRHVRSSYFDHALLDTLVDVLSEEEGFDRPRLERLWRERRERDAEQMTRTDRLGALRERILAHYMKPDRDSFERLVSSGFDLLERHETPRAIRTLERAAALAPDNAHLNAFIGEHFYRAGKTTLARDYLARAFDAAPEDHRVCLLLGLACGDEGEAARARDLLSEAVRRGGASFAAHYALGRLRAAEGDWKGALNEFKRALAARSCPEAHYINALAYYHLERPRMALRHLIKAVEMDARYGEAFYALGMVHLQMGERERAEEAFEAAHAIDSDEPRYRTARRLLRRAGGVPLPPLLFGAAKSRGKRLMTGGDSRLAAALQSDALEIPVAR